MVLLVSAWTCTALAAAPALAATTIGDNLAAVPTNSYYACGSSVPVTELACTLTQIELGEGRAAAGGLVAPAAGVVVRWRVRTGVALAGTTVAKARLALVEGNDRGGARESTYTELPLDEPGVHVYPARLPIAAGERIAVDAIVSGSGDEALPIDHEDSFVGSPAIWSPILATGEERTSGTAPTDGEEFLLNADVEPDADHDGYGDETQDECPGNSALHAGCKALAPAPPLVPAPADKTPPRTKLTYPPRQDFAGAAKVLVRLRSNEAATAVASGQLEVGSGPTKSKGRDIWGLTGVRRQVQAGAKTPLRLRLPRKTREAARQALAQGRKAVVKVVVTATDAAGNRSGATVAVIRPMQRR
jgi:hypothetical protein